MDGYNTIEDIKVEGKRVLLRLELNAPIKEGIVTDMTRIDAALPAIRELLKKKAKVIIMAHLGRPNGNPDPGYSLKPIANAIAKIAGIDVDFSPDCIGPKAASKINSLEAGDVLVLENLRFHPGEENNDADFVDKLSENGDVYINDAFGVTHREHASIVGVPLKFHKEGKPVGLGPLMEKELSIWGPILKSEGPGVLVIGGGKLKEKIKAIGKLASGFDHVIVGGVVGNVMLAAKGIDVGKSLISEKGDDNDYVSAAGKLLEGNKNIILPDTVVIENRKDVKVNEGLEGHIICDMLLSSKAKEALRSARKAVWFGPLGIYEEGFTKGTDQVKDAINSNKDIDAVLGGGDSAAAAKGLNAKISTGGGASITLLSKGTLEALEAVRNNTSFFR